MTRAGVFADDEIAKQEPGGAGPKIGIERAARHQRPGLTGSAALDQPVDGENHGPEPQRRPLLGDLIVGEHALVLVHQAVGGRV